MHFTSVASSGHTPFVWDCEIALRFLPTFLWLLLVHCLLGMYSSAMWVLVSASIRFMSRICVFGRSVLVLACNEFDR